MKQISLKIVFFIFFVINCHFLSAHNLSSDSTELKVTYRYQQKARTDGEEILLTDSMGLFIENNKSRYFDLDLARRDSVENSNFKRTQTFRVSPGDDELERKLELNNDAYLTLSQLEYNKTHFYKDRSINQIITKHRTIEIIEGLKVVEDIVFDWDIPNLETDTILGYPCMLATTNFRGRTYSAWFTLEIPINDGPWKFYGLPGLILKVEDSEGIFTFNAIGLEWVKKQIIKPQFQKIEVVTNKQLKDYINNSRKLVTYAFHNGDNATLYYLNNNMSFSELEIEDE